jgi:hypothetical protein
VFLNKSYKNALISFAMPLCLSVRPHVTIQELLNRFSRYLWVLQTSVDILQFLLKSDKNGCSTRTHAFRRAGITGREIPTREIPAPEFSCHSQRTNILANIPELFGKSEFNEQALCCSTVQVFKTGKCSNIAFRVATSCSHVSGYKCFGGTCGLHLQNLTLRTISAGSFPLKCW